MSQTEDKFLTLLLQLVTLIHKKIIGKSIKWINVTPATKKHNKQKYLRSERFNICQIFFNQTLRGKKVLVYKKISNAIFYK